MELQSRIGGGSIGKGEHPPSRAISGRGIIMGQGSSPPTPFLCLGTTEIIAKIVGIGGSSIYRRLKGKPLSSISHIIREPQTCCTR